MYRACYYASRTDDLKVKYTLPPRPTREAARGDLDRVAGRIVGYTGGHIELHLHPFGWIVYKEDQH